MNSTVSHQKKFIEIVKSAVIVPLIFVMLVFAILYMLLSPYISMITSAFAIISTSSAPKFDNELESVFVKPTETEETSQEETISVSDSSDVNENSNDISDIEDIQETTEAEIMENTVDISDIVMPKYEQHYANLSIPSVEIDCNLYYGDSDEVLKRGAGQFMGSRLPGFGSPILIAAHNTSYFRALEWIENNAVIQIDTSYGTYKYQVYETKIAKYNDETAYDLTLDEEILILYTCHPFGSLGYKSDRLFIYANKISGPVVDW